MIKRSRIVGAAAIFLGLLAPCEAARGRGARRSGDTGTPRGADRAAADRYYEIAKRAFEQLEYAKALELVERALGADPMHKASLELARKARSLLGTRPDWVRHGLDELTREKKVQIQESLFQLQRTLSKGREFLRLAAEFHEGDDVRAPERRLSRDIENLDRAIEHFRRVIEIIKWMPYKLDLSSTMSEVKGLLKDALNLRASKEEELRAERRRKAAGLALVRRNREVEILRERLQQMMAIAQVLFSQGKFEKCENLCAKIIRDDPTDKNAPALAAQSRQKRHELLEEELYVRHRHEWRKMFQNVEEAAIPYDERVIWPSDWERIRRRVEKAGKLEQLEEPEWQKEIRRKLDRKVSFEFADTPLTEAIAFLQTLTKVNMIIDPSARESRGSTPITLKVTNMTLGVALDWILRLAEIDFALKDNAIFISSRENLKGDVLLRIYDVRDLTERVPDYPGPDLQVEVGGMDSGAAGLVLEMETMVEDVTAASLADMIRERVRPDEWAPELGTSIEERGGKLVVMQRPEVHRLIDRLLESFRSYQKLLVTVEGRFLEIREGFFEEIGIDFGRIPDVGGTPAEYLPNNPSIAAWPTDNVFGYGGPGVGTIDSQTLSADVSPIYAGIMLQPQNVDIFGGSEMHVIGSVANFRPGLSPEQTTIGMDLGTGTLLDQGLNAQIRRIGNIELMAFLHALKIREGGSTLAAPRLTLMNTQRAHMFVAEQVSYIADYEISGDLWDPIIRQFLRGVIFDVKPIVSADRRYITLEMRPTTADLERMPTILIRQYIALQYQDGSIAESVQFPIQFPELVLRKLRTTVTIPDGGIILLGGLMTDVKFHGSTGVPFLSNIPIIGKLFRWDILDNERKNLSILVTARILLYEEEEKKLN